MLYHFYVGVWVGSLESVVSFLAILTILSSSLA